MKLPDTATGNGLTYPSHNKPLSESRMTQIIGVYISSSVWETKFLDQKGRYPQCLRMAGYPRNIPHTNVTITMPADFTVPNSGTLSPFTDISSPSKFLWPSIISDNFSIICHFSEWPTWSFEILQNFTKDDIQSFNSNMAWTVFPLAIYYITVD